MTPQQRMRLEVRPEQHLAGQEIRDMPTCFQRFGLVFACRARGYAACCPSPAWDRRVRDYWVPQHSRERIGTEQTAPSSSKPADHEPATGILWLCVASDSAVLLIGCWEMMVLQQGMTVIWHESVRIGHEPIDVFRTDWSRTGIEAADYSFRCHLFVRQRSVHERNLLR